jgi:Spy/CpxP family protein refolding chaperone
MLRRLSACALGCALLFAIGCEPKCREVRPAGDIQDEFRERIDDQLDEVDATDSQIAKTQALFAAQVPALEKLRAEAFPVQHQIVAELKKQTPDRARLFGLIDQMIASTIVYVNTMLDTMLKAHALLDSGQRQAMAKRYSKPSPPLRGSFWIDRGFDYFMLKISATDSQRKLIERIKAALLKRARLLIREADGVRFAIVAEFAKDHPDRARIDAAVERGRLLAQQMFVELTGYYLLVQSKLDREQRTVVDAQLVRLEPCPTMTDGRAAAPY